MDHSLTVPLFPALPLFRNRYAVLKPGDAPTAVHPVLPCWADWGVSTPYPASDVETPQSALRSSLRHHRGRGVSNLPATQTPRPRMVFIPFHEELSERGSGSNLRADGKIFE
jgi:hypothetical protein